MNVYKLKSEFLESEMEEIIFTYHKDENILELSKYSASMLDLPTVIENPFQNEKIVSRLKSESYQDIVSKMDLKSTEKKEVEISFMYKPFKLKYQCVIQNEELLAVVCMLKEKMSYES